MTTRFSTTQAVSSRSLARKTRPLLDCSGRSKRGLPGEIGFRTTPIGSGFAIIRAFKLWCSDSGARKSTEIPSMVLVRARRVASPGQFPFDFQLQRQTEERAD